MGLEKKESEHNGDIDAVSERMVKLELRTNENEQYHRRLCLRITLSQLHHAVFERETKGFKLRQLM